MIDRLMINDSGLTLMIINDLRSLITSHWLVMIPVMHDHRLLIAEQWW